MMLVAECVLTKLLPDLYQPNAVVRRVHLSRTCCPIYVSRMMLLAVLSDLHQPHSVIRRHHRVIGDRETSPSPASVNSNSECECPCQSHDVAHRVRLGQTVARSMSAV